VGGQLRGRGTGTGVGYRILYTARTWVSLAWVHGRRRFCFLGLKDSRRGEGL
jgi:hypothetical protein